MFEYMIFAFIVANTIVLGAQVCHLIKGRGSNVTVVYDSFSFDSRVYALLEISIFVVVRLYVCQMPLKILKWKWSLISFKY